MNSTYSNEEIKNIISTCLEGNFKGYKDSESYLHFMEMNLEFLSSLESKNEIKGLVIAFDIIGRRMEKAPELFSLFYGEDIAVVTFKKAHKFLHGIKSLDKSKSFSNIPNAIYTIKSMHDEHTCKVCKKNDGKIYPLKKAILGKNFPPFNDCTCEYCRCYASFSLKK